MRAAPAREIALMDSEFAAYGMRQGGLAGFFAIKMEFFFGFFKFFYILSLQNRRKRSNISPHPAMSGQRKWLGSSVGRAAD